MQCLKSDCDDFIQENIAIQAKAYIYKDNLKLYIKVKYLIYCSQSLTWHPLPRIFLWLPFSSCRSYLNVAVFTLFSQRLSV